MSSGGLGGKRRSTQTTLPFKSSEKRAKADSLLPEVQEGLENLPLEDPMNVDSPSGAAAAAAHAVPQLGVRKIGGAAPQKRLIVKDFKLKPQLPPDFEETTWKKLQEAIVAVQHKTPVNASLQELYQAVENLCTHKMEASLFEKLQRQCEDHIRTEVNRLLGQAVDARTYLALMDSCWQDHCSQMHMLRSIFLHLDRRYVIQTPARSIWDVGLALFRQHVVSHPEVQQRVVQSLLHQIETDRRGEMVERPLLASQLRMLSALQMYVTVFQRPFIDATSAFYQEEGERLLSQSEVPAYLRHVEARLTEESDRCTHYLDQQTRRPLLAAVERELVERHLETVLERGFDDMVAGQRVAELALLFRLLLRVGASDRLRSALQQHVKRVGMVRVADTSRDDTLIADLLDMRGRLDQLLERSFANDEAYVHAVRDAFEAFIDSRQNRPAELLAKYVDSKLRSGGARMTEDEVEAALDHAMVLFRYLHGKDAFEAFYKKDLARRLLLGKSVSMELERGMVQRLKAECGAGYTAKLDGMFKDMDASGDIQTAFLQFLRSDEAAQRAADSVELSVQVLTSNTWPTYPPSDAVLPPQLARFQDAFLRFYNGKHSGRRLAWVHGLGSTVLRATFPKGKKELAVSLYQTLVLLLFNDAEQLSFEDIETATRLDNTELRRTLASLACGSARLLLKQPEGGDPAPGDIYRYNSDFTHKLFRLKVNAVQLREVPTETRETNAEVEQARQHQIDAAVVRVMKTRKTLEHQLLLAELFKLLRFPVKAADVKKRIDSLIEREYLERDTDDPNKYHYVS